MANEHVDALTLLGVRQRSGKTLAGAEMNSARKGRNLQVAHVAGHLDIARRGARVALGAVGARVKRSGNVPTQIGQRETRGLFLIHHQKKDITRREKGALPGRFR